MHVHSGVLRNLIDSFRLLMVHSEALICKLLKIQEFIKKGSGPIETMVRRYPSASSLGSSKLCFTQLPKVCCT